MVPSPKSNVYATIGVLSRSAEAEASAVTVSGAAPELGVRVTAAVGGESATDSVRVRLARKPAVSVTVMVTV